jgi:hypothetical protein
MHEYAQKSTTTTLPRRLSGVSGLLLSHAVAPVSGGSAPSVFAGPLAPLRGHHCAALCRFFCGGHHHRAATRGRSRRGTRDRLHARSFRVARRHGPGDIERRQQTFKIAHFRQIVVSDVRLRRMVDQVILVITLRLVESFQWIDARHDAARIHTGMVELRDIRFGNLLLRFVGVEDRERYCVPESGPCRFNCVGSCAT